MHQVLQFEPHCACRVVGHHHRNAFTWRLRDTMSDVIQPTCKLTKVVEVDDHDGLKNPDRDGQPNENIEPALAQFTVDESCDKTCSTCNRLHDQHLRLTALCLMPEIWAKTQSRESTASRPVSVH